MLQFNAKMTSAPGKTPVVVDAKDTTDQHVDQVEEVAAFVATVEASWPPNKLHELHDVFQADETRGLCVITLERDDLFIQLLSPTDQQVVRVYIWLMQSDPSELRSRLSRLDPRRTPVQHPLPWTSMGGHYGGPESPLI